MWPIIISIAGAVGLLALLAIQFLSGGEHILYKMKKNKLIRLWNAFLITAAFFSFLSTAFIFYNGGGSSFAYNEREDIVRRADSLSNLLDSVRMSQAGEKSDFYKREKELSTALKSKITGAYTLAAPVVRTDTVIIVIRDTASEKKIKEKLDRIQVKNFELLRIVDSLRAVNAGSDKD
jgi:hypothetical protein